MQLHLKGVKFHLELSILSNLRKYDLLRKLQYTYSLTIPRIETQTIRYALFK